LVRPDQTEAELGDVTANRPERTRMHVRTRSSQNDHPYKPTAGLEDECFGTRTQAPEIHATGGNHRKDCGRPTSRGLVKRHAIADADPPVICSTETSAPSSSRVAVASLSHGLTNCSADAICGRKGVGRARGLAELTMSEKMSANDPGAIFSTMTSHPLQRSPFLITCFYSPSFLQVSQL